MKKINFISGLPRSGSTLLSAILNQNPRFYAGITDPLYRYITHLVKNLDEVAGATTIVTTEKLHRIMKATVDSFYYDIHKPVIFNTNRAWTTQVDQLKQLYPNFKMIVCFRNVVDILNSFEKIHAKTPNHHKVYYGDKTPEDVFARCYMLTEGQGMFNPGLVINTLNSMQQACMSSHTSNILFLHYDALVKEPQTTLQNLYNFLEEPFFEHDLQNVASSYDEYDALLGIPGMHTTRRELTYAPEKSLLPPILQDQYSFLDFWKHPNFHERKNILNWLELINISDQRVSYDRQ